MGALQSFLRGRPSHPTSGDPVPELGTPPSDLPFAFPVRQCSRFTSLVTNWRSEFCEWIGCRSLWGRAERIGYRKLVKYGYPNEALTLEFIRRRTTIPVPRVHDCFTDAAYPDRMTQIIMDYVPGVELEKVWLTMTPEDQLCIIHQLRDYLKELRSLIPPAPGYVGGVYGMPCRDPRIRINKTWGPFPDSKGWQKVTGEDWMRRNLDRVKHLEDFKDRPEYIEVFNRTASRTYRSVFTHGDLAPRNILVRGTKIVAIVDWEAAGWYPAYWELSRTYFASWGEFESFYDLFAAECLEERFEDEFKVDIATEAVFNQG